MDINFTIVDNILKDYYDRKYFPSAVCSVFDHTGMLHEFCIGPVETDTWYDLASVSKIICTTLILQLMEEGLLTPEDPVLSFLPEGRAGCVTAKRLYGVTVRQLMTHTSGITAWFPFYTDGRDFYKVLERVLSETAPEDGMVYSDLNYMLLGEIFSEITGLTLREGLERYIKQPLGITDMLYGPVDPDICAPSCYGNQIEKEMCAERGLSFNGWRPDGEKVQGTCNDGNAFYYWHGASGHAGVFANAHALVCLCQMYMNTDRPYHLMAMEENTYGRGLGFDKGISFPEGCGHSGFTGTSIWFSRSHDIGAVILTNKYGFADGTKPGNSNEFRRAVHYSLLGLPIPEV